MKKHLLLLFLLIPYYNFATIYYVKPVASGTGNGLSWANATTLQNAVYLVTALDEIWVMQGTYYPSTGSGRFRTLLINNGTIKIYGGFQGGEILQNQRNPSIYPTIISGDFNNDDSTTNFDPSETNRQENAYHLITVKTTPANPTINFTIDGFVLKGGNANGATQTTGAASTQYYHTRGGAIYAQTLVINDVINIYVKNSILEKNSGTDTSVASAYYSSGIIYQTIRTNFDRCIFKNNVATTNSAILIAGANGYNIFGYGEISNCLFHNNTSTSGASCLTSSASLANGGTTAGIDVKIKNNTFTSNSGSSSNVFKITEGANVSFLNNIVFGNGGSNPLSLLGTTWPAFDTNIIQGTLLPPAHSNADPLLNPDFTLSSGSPAINSGNNSWTTGMVYDLMGQNRIIDSTVDKGCYEYNPALNNTNFDSYSQFTIYPNPASDEIKVNSSETIESITIIALDGRKIKTTSASSINISDLANGIYVMQVTTESGKTGNKKFVKN